MTFCISFLMTFFNDPFNLIFNDLFYDLLISFWIRYVVKNEIELAHFEVWGNLNQDATKRELKSAFANLMLENLHDW